MSITTADGNNKTKKNFFQAPHGVTHLFASSHNHFWVEAHPTVVLQLFFSMHINGYTRCECNEKKKQLQRKSKRKEKNTHKKI
jgi:hypothetical protein